MKVYQTEMFHNDEGIPLNRLTEFDLVDGELTSPKSLGHTVTYQGTFSVNTPMGPASITFDFPEGYTMEECFEHYEEEAENRVEELKKEMEQKALEKRIITPKDAGGLIMP